MMPAVLSDTRHLVSVVMPCYNNARYIEEALASVFAQTYPEIEVIVVDDGSTDASHELLVALQQTYSFTLLQQLNQGVSAALNLGLSVAKGEYVVTPDSDDVLLPDAVAVRVDYLERHPGVGLVGGKVIYTNVAGIETKREALRGIETYGFTEVLGSAMAVGAPVTMYRMAALRAVGFYDPAIRIQDFQITLRVANAGYGVACLPAYITRYRRHPDSLSRKYRQQLDYDLAAIEPYREHRAWSAGRMAVINKALKYSVRQDAELSWMLLRSAPLGEWNSVTVKRAKGLLAFTFKVPFTRAVQALASYVLNGRRSNQ
ncbi:glycosyltransferase family 2 protein [Pseudomonas japonica]|uniref:glycosyltransferase family 2 protein n=1 Tax=Pseudomonas japonica TaxID=256466 RepID=UPI0015E4619B|nr:glycosyltransferase [Pseudomonas japonica]MBA1244168.1 glycosyltransferase [Pseudomonas japonica]